MPDLKLSDAASELLDRFVSVFPVLSREANQKKILDRAEHLMLKQGQTEANRDLLLEAITTAYPGSYEPVILRHRDPELLSALVHSQKALDAGNPAVHVRCWPISDIPGTGPVKRVLALLAGPRRGGNTDCILDAFLDGAREAGAGIEKYCFSDLTLLPCSGCMACEAKTLPTFCAIRDDMAGLYQKLIDCDAFVMGFPVYTARECSQAAIFFDRLKALRSPGHYCKLGRIRKGALVVTWGWPTDNAYCHVVEDAAFVLKLFGIETAAVVTGSGFWDAYYPRGTAKLDAKGLEQAASAGRALVTG